MVERELKVKNVKGGFLTSTRTMGTVNATQDQIREENEKQNRRNHGVIITRYETINQYDADEAINALISNQHLMVNISTRFMTLSKQKEHFEAPSIILGKSARN